MEINFNRFFGTYANPVRFIIGIIALVPNWTGVNPDVYSKVVTSDLLKIIGSDPVDTPISVYAANMCSSLSAPWVSSFCFGCPYRCY